MLNIEQQIKKFDLLSHKEKRKKVISMLFYLKDTSDIFNKFYKTLTIIINISDDIILYIYKSILEISLELERGNKEIAEKKIKHMTTIIQTIKDEEKIDKLKDWDIESILKKI